MKRLLLFLLLPPALHAQNARLAFASDTLAVGQPVEVRLEIVHPASMTVIFPALEEAFAPFEHLSTAAEPTVTHGGQSKDVAVYQVSTFEMAESQTLSLPWAYVTDGGDTVVQRVTSNAVHLNRRSQPGDTALRADRAALSLRDEPDYVILTLLALGAVIALGIAGALARKPLMRWYARRHVRAQWQALYKRWSALRNETETPAVLLEHLSHLWKEYIDLGVRPPLRSFTTPELEAIIRRQQALSPEHQQALILSSRWADEVIYAAKPAPDREALLNLHASIGEILKLAYIRKSDAIQG